MRALISPLVALAFLHLAGCPFAVASDWVFEKELFLPQQDFGHYAIREGDLLLRAQQSVFDEPLATDRPDFTEASSVVGRGVLQIEAGYTYFYDDEDGTRTRSHTAPETLFRYGITDNVELRLVWSYAWQDTATAGSNEFNDGAEDLILGTKIALTSQEGYRPESAIILDMSTPTGGREFTNTHTEYGMNYLYGWDLPNDRSFAGSFGYSTATQITAVPAPPPETIADRHNVFHASVAHGVSLSDTVGMYIEYFGLYVDGLSGGRPENYIDAGGTYLLNNNVQFDVRLGVGLNNAATDLFAGTGLSLRM